MATPLRLGVSYPVFRLLEQGKITPEEFKDKARRMASGLDRIEAEAVKELRSALGDVDRDIRDAIGSAADADALSRSDINGVIDRAVDRFEERHRRTLQRGTQGAVDEAQKFRQDLARSVGQPAPEAPVQRGLARDLGEIANETNSAFARDLRNKLKREVSVGIADGKTPRQIAGDMVKKRIVTPKRVPQTDAEKAERKRQGLPEKKARGALAKAEELTRNQVRSGFNSANFSGARAEQRTKAGILKSWVDRDDGRVRPSHVKAGNDYALNGNPGPIPVHINFKVGGVLLRFPNDPAGPLSETAGCRCLVVEIIPEVVEELAGQ